MKIEKKGHLNFWSSLRHIPKAVWCLGIATFLMNASTIIIFSYSPLYLTTVMGVSMAVFGRIEGFVEMLSWLVRVISGVLSDFFRKRKVFILLSYALGALARPIFPLATSVTGIVIGRALDRISNGLQATPREALIADLAPSGLKGACFGVRQALGTAGSAVGAIIGVAVMLLSKGNYQIVFWIATFPAVLAVALLVFMIEDPRFSSETGKHVREKPKLESPIRMENLRHFTFAYWMVVVLTMIFLLGRFSGSFLIKYAQQLGMSEEYAPTIMIVFNIISSLSAYPLGALSDRVDRRLTLCIGFCLIILADIVLATANSIPMVLIGVMLWGAQFGVTQSIPMAMIADLAPKKLRGTAFGIFYIGCGISLFFSNTIAGWITEQFGQSYTFLTSASIVIFAVIGMWYVKITPLVEEPA